jgi:hypothetical protein
LEAGDKVISDSIRFSIEVTRVFGDLVIIAFGNF